MSANDNIDPPSDVEKLEVERLNAEVLALLNAVKQTHTKWALAYGASVSTRITSFIAFRALTNTFNLNDQPYELREAAIRYADAIQITTLPAGILNSQKLGQA